MTGKRILTIVILIFAFQYISGIFMERFQFRVERRESLEKEVAIIDTYVNNSAVRQNTERLFQTFPSEIDSLEQKTQFYQFEKQAGVSLVSVSEGGGSRTTIPAFTSQNTEEKQTDKQSRYFTPQANSLTYTLKVEGSFKEQIAFLRGLENANQLMQIQNVSFESADQEEGGVVSTIQVVVYYQK